MNEPPETTNNFGMHWFSGAVENSCLLPPPGFLASPQPTGLRQDCLRAG
jgi:hypothetical protein